MDPQPPAPALPNFCPTHADIASVRSLLTRKLPPELVEPILDFAGYWVCVTASLDKRTTAPTKAPNFHDCYLLLLHSPPVLGPRKELQLGIRKPVKKIVFKIESRDQGWSSEPKTFHGTYDRSYTWFEAYLERPSNPEAAAEAKNLVQPIDITCDMRDADNNHKINPLIGGDRGVGWELVDIAGKRKWDVQRNVHASKQLKKHTIVWNADDEDMWASEVVFENGSTSGGEFVRAMEGGDRVLLVARAQFLGWCNYIESAKVEIYYTG